LWTLLEPQKSQKLAHDLIQQTETNSTSKVHI